jgi:hypothetical protein
VVFPEGRIDLRRLEAAAYTEIKGESRMTFRRAAVGRLAVTALLGCSANGAPAPVGAQTTEPAPAARQTQSDDYTRYELLDPASASFRIVYEVTATSPGAKYFWNPIRKGSIASNESVSDPASGLPLKFVEVSGAEAKTNGLGNADPETRYIQIELPRPVPREGEIRLVIDKTYKDDKSYFVEEKTGFIVFSRSLGIRRNSVVLPVGYEVVACNYPSQVFPEPVASSGPATSPPQTRLRMSFMNIGTDSASYVVKARRVAK